MPQPVRSFGGHLGFRINVKNGASNNRAQMYTTMDFRLALLSSQINEVICVCLIHIYSTEKNWVSCPHYEYDTAFFANHNFQVKMITFGIKTYLLGTYIVVTANRTRTDKCSVCSPRLNSHVVNYRQAYTGSLRSKGRQLGLWRNG